MKAIGAWPDDKKKKKKQPTKATYQDSVAAPLDRELDNNAVDFNEEEDNDGGGVEQSETEGEETHSQVLSVVQKVRNRVNVSVNLPLKSAYSCKKLYALYDHHHSVAEQGSKRSSCPFARLTRH